MAKNGYFEPENEKSDLNSNSTSNILLEMTHSWFLAIFGLPSTIFVKVDPILRFWPNFHEIAIFAENPPENGRKNFFSPFLLFFLKIYPYLVSFDQFWAPKVILASKYSQILISLDPPFLPIFQYPVIQNMGKSRKIQMAAIS